MNNTKIAIQCQKSRARTIKSANIKSTDFDLVIEYHYLKDLSNYYKESRINLSFNMLKIEFI